MLNDNGKFHAYIDILFPQNVFKTKVDTLICFCVYQIFCVNIGRIIFDPHIDEVLGVLFIITT